ncbi:MAG: dihydropteroate synthase [Candidatus Kapabacteria bacterium]|nr:dihydropteroate synthase [Candidatus Kapabacteria bacterium]
MNTFPKIMGILNITSDSFSDGGLFIEKDLAIDRALQMIDEGADIIDIGGESTRPGSLPVDEKEELDRTIPVITAIRAINQNIRISIDTTRPKVALSAVKAGANYINDVSGLRKSLELASIAAEHKAGLIIMHSIKTPENMQIDPVYKNVLSEVFSFLKTQITKANEIGVKEIYADVGIGFGKSIDHNLELLNNLDFFYKLNVPLVLGISRKAFIGKLTSIESPKDRDIATVLIHSLLLKNKLSIIRVHNVKMAATLKKLYQSLSIS